MSSTGRRLSDAFYSTLFNVLSKISKLFNFEVDLSISDENVDDSKADGLDNGGASLSSVLELSQNLWIIKTTFSVIQQTLLWLADVCEIVQQWLTLEIDDPQHDVQCQRDVTELLRNLRERLRDSVESFRLFLASHAGRKSTQSESEILDDLDGTINWCELTKEFDALLKNTNSMENEESPAGGSQETSAVNGSQERSSVNGGGGRSAVNGGQGRSAVNGGGGRSAVNGGQGRSAVNGGQERSSFNGGGGRSAVNGIQGRSAVNGGQERSSVNGGQGRSGPNNEIRPIRRSLPTDIGKTSRENLNPCLVAERKSMDGTPNVVRCSENEVVAPSEKSPNDDEIPSPSDTPKDVRLRSQSTVSDNLDYVEFELDRMPPPNQTQSDTGDLSSRRSQWISNSRGGVFRPQFHSFSNYEEVDSGKKDAIPGKTFDDWTESEERKARVIDDSQHNNTNNSQLSPDPCLTNQMKEQDDSPNNKSSSPLIESEMFVFGPASKISKVENANQTEDQLPQNELTVPVVKQPGNEIPQGEKPMPSECLNSSQEEVSTPGSSSKISEQDDREYCFSGYMFYPGLRGFVILNTVKPNKDIPTRRQHRIICFDTTKFAEAVADKLRPLLQNGKDGDTPVSDIVQVLLQCCKDSIHFSTLTVPSSQKSTNGNRSESTNDQEPGKPPSDQPSSDVTASSAKETAEFANENSSTSSDDSLSDAIDESIRLALQCARDSRSDEWSKVRDSFSMAEKSLRARAPDRMDDIPMDGEDKQSSSKTPMDGKTSGSKRRRVRFNDADIKVCSLCASEDIEFPENRPDFFTRPMLHANHDTLPPDVVEVREFVDGKLRVYTEERPELTNDKTELLDFHSRWSGIADRQSTDTTDIDVMEHGTEMTDASMRVIYPVTKYLPKIVRSRSFIRHPRTFSKIHLPSKIRHFDPYLVPSWIRQGHIPSRREPRNIMAFIGKQKTRRRYDDKVYNNGERKCCPSVTVLWNFMHDIQKAGYLQGPPLLLRLNQDDATQEAMEALMCSSRIHLGYYSDILVHFKDENGVESRSERCQSLFTEFSRIFFSPGRYRIFDYPSESSNVIHLNPVYKGDDRAIRFAGMVLALAILHGKHLKVNLPVAFFKCLLDRPFTVRDVAEVDPILYVKLEWMKRNKLCESDVQMKFRIKDRVGDSVVYHDLVPNGSEIPVTDCNKQQFIEKAVTWKLAKRCIEQLKEFRRGFISILEPFLLSVFTAEELEYLAAAEGELPEPWEHYENHLGPERRGTM